MKAEEDSLPKNEWWISTIMNNCLQKTLFCVGIIWSIMLSILSLLLIPADVSVIVNCTAVAIVGAAEKLTSVWLGLVDVAQIAASAQNMIVFV